MKRTTTMKVTLSIVAVLMCVGAMAQTYPAAIKVDYTKVAETSYQTELKPFYLYVAPDPVYSPSYDAVTNTLMNATSQWYWSYGGFPGTMVKTWTTSENWVLITPALADGTRTYWAAERFGVAGCSDATGKSQVVTILPAPAASITGAALQAGWSTNTALHDFFRCSAGTGENLTVAFAEAGVPAAWASYAYSIQKVATGYDAGGLTVVGPTTITLINYGVAALSKYQTSTAGGGSNLTGTGALPYLTIAGPVNVRTKYVFTLKGYTGSASDGIVSAVSHKSDYGGAVMMHPFTGDVTVTYWINLPPVTGPIYHISNSYAY